MNKKAVLLVALLLFTAFIPVLTGCGFRERPFLNQDRNVDSIDSNGDSEEPAGSTDGKLVVDELEQEINELLDLLDQLETVDESDLEL